MQAEVQGPTPLVSVFKGGDWEQLTCHWAPPAPHALALHLHPTHACTPRTPAPHAHLLPRARPSNAHTRHTPRKPPATGFVELDTQGPAVPRLLLGLQPTSFRNALGACGRQGGTLVLLQNQEKQDQVLTALGRAAYEVGAFGARSGGREGGEAGACSV